MKKSWGVIFEMLNRKVKNSVPETMNFQSRDTAQTLVELCAIRDVLSTCNALSYLDACELINLISLD